MRIKTELSEMPPAFTVSREGQKAVIIFYTDVQEKQLDDGSTAYEAISWTMEVPWLESLETRISANLASWLALAQQEASQIAAAAAREIRDRLLEESDASMALDRLGLSVPSGSTFSGSSVSTSPHLRETGQKMLTASPIMFLLGMKPQFRPSRLL